MIDAFLTPCQVQISVVSLYVFYLLLFNPYVCNFAIDINYMKYRKRRCGMIVNETTLHKRQNDTEFNIYVSPYGLQQ